MGRFPHLFVDAAMVPQPGGKQALRYHWWLQRGQEKIASGGGHPTEAAARAEGAAARVRYLQAGRRER